MMTFVNGQYAMVRYARTQPEEGPFLVVGVEERRHATGATQMLTFDYCPASRGDVPRIPISSKLCRLLPNFDPLIESRARELVASGNRKLSSNPYEGGTEEWHRWHAAFTEAKRAYDRDSSCAQRATKERPTRQQIDARRAQNRAERNKASQNKGNSSKGK